MTHSRRPSLPDIIEAATGSHSLESDPPAIRWIDRRVGKVVRVLLTHRYTWIAIAHATGAAHLLAWAKLLGWLK
jgi:hypothetical protein